MLPQNKPDRIRILFDDHRLSGQWPALSGHPSPAPVREPSTITLLR